MSQFVYLSLVLGEHQETKTKYSAPKTHLMIAEANIATRHFQYNLVSLPIYLT